MKYDSSYTNEVMMFRTSENKWNTPEILDYKGNAPPARAYSSAVVYRNCMYIFGGKGIEIMNDLSEFDLGMVTLFILEYYTWKEVPYTSKYKVPKLYGHTSFIGRDKMYVFGGKDDNGHVSWDLWSFDFITSHWTQIIPSDPLFHPPKRYFAASITYHKKALIFGGTNDEIAGLSDLWTFDYSTNEWMEISAKNPIESERFGHSLFFVDDVLHIIGGYHDGKDVNTVITCDFESGVENLVTKSSLKLERFSHSTFFTAIYLKKTLYLFGGIQKVKYDGKPLYILEWDPMLEIKAALIPYEAAVHILSFLETRDRLKMALVSKKLTLTHATRDNTFWNPIYTQIFHKSEKELSTLVKSGHDSLYHDFMKQMKLLTNQIVSSYKYKDAHHKYYNPYGFVSLRIHGYPCKSLKDMSLRIYLIGDAKVGKTSMISVLGGQLWPHSNLPIFHDELVVQFELKDSTVSLNIYDMDNSLKDPSAIGLGIKDAAKYRSVFVLCFSIASRDSFDSIKSKYLLEIKKHAPEFPIILCGTMGDLREKENESLPIFVKFVSKDEAIALAKEIGCISYIETTSLIPKSVFTLVDLAGVSLTFESHGLLSKDCLVQ